MKKILFGGACVLASASIVWAAGNDDILARQTAMKAVGAAAKAGDFEAMNKAAMAAQAAFKVDTRGAGDAKTEASDAIWANPAGFDDQMGKLIALSEAGDKSVFGTCKACHADYRVKN